MMAHTFLIICTLWGASVAALVRSHNPENMIPTNEEYFDQSDVGIRSANGNCSFSSNGGAPLAPFLDDMKAGVDDEPVPDPDWIYTAPRTPRPCPCTNVSLCLPIVGQPKEEVYVVSIKRGNWPDYDWSKITTIVEWQYIDDKLMCFAHALGIRVVIKATFKKKDIMNGTQRMEWAHTVSNVISANFVDGVNVDFERAYHKNDTMHQTALNELLRGLADTMRASNPQAQLSIDVGFFPGEGVRYYDFKTIATFADFLFIMDYGTGLQHLTVWANAAYNITLKGIRSYIADGVPANKLLLGVDWGGKMWPCSRFNETTQRCRVTLRDEPGTDDVGRKHTIKWNVKYFDIVKMLPQSCSGRLWDPVAKSPFADFKVKHSIQQLWYDDPESCLAKYDMVRDMGMRGVGVWYADSISYKDPSQVSGMWGVLPHREKEESGWPKPAGLGSESADQWLFGGK